MKGAKRGEIVQKSVVIGCVGPAARGEIKDARPRCQYSLYEARFYSPLISPCTSARIMLSNCSETCGDA
eukprot:2037913-Rhodomonas_salina.2